MCIYKIVIKKKDLLDLKNIALFATATIIEVATVTNKDFLAQLIIREVNFNNFKSISIALYKRVKYFEIKYFIKLKSEKRLRTNLPEAFKN